MLVALAFNVIRFADSVSVIKYLFLHCDAIAPDDHTWSKPGALVLIMEWHCILDLLHDSWNCMAESYANLMQVYQQFVAVNGHTIFLVLSENHYNAAQYIGVLFKSQLRWQTWFVGQNL